MLSKREGQREPTHSALDAEKEFSWQTRANVGPAANAETDTTRRLDLEKRSSRAKPVNRSELLIEIIVARFVVLFCSFNGSLPQVWRRGFYCFFALNDCEL